MCYGKFDMHDFRLMVKVRCGFCSRLVTVNLRDKYCPICRKKLYK